LLCLLWLVVRIVLIPSLRTHVPSSLTVLPEETLEELTKLKSAVQLQDLLDATRMLVPRTRPGRESDSDPEDLEHAEKLRQVKAVLEEGGNFSGIYRKVQLKPLKWDGEGEKERPVEALMILKYGGVLTHAGRKQAEELGRFFRYNMYPGEGTGLLRLHSTYRHDLKIYSSDEGRVQMSAAAFAKGLLDLEGQLTPILVSLVSKDSSMLDGLDTASTEMEVAKLARDLYNERKDRFDITQIPDIYDSCKYDLLHNSHLGLQGLDELFKVAQLLADGVIPNEYGINPQQKLKIGSKVDIFSRLATRVVYIISSGALISYQNLFFRVTKKVARRLMGKILIDLRNTREEAMSVAELKEQHVSLSLSSSKKHQDKNISPKRDDLRRPGTGDKDEDDDDKETKYRLDPKYANVKTPERHVRTRLYFTSESHIHSLMNVLRYCNLDESLQGEESLISQNALERLFKTKELDYMSYIVLRLFENTEVSLEDPKRFRIELTFSRGADLSPLEQKNDDEAESLMREHTLPIMGPERLQEVGSCLTLETMEKMVHPFAMPPEDFPPASAPVGFSGYFSKSAAVLERLVKLFHSYKNSSSDGKS
ncbi:hypothetical protein DY000_02003472, partial [Brassica cretica]